MKGGRQISINTMLPVHVIGYVEDDMRTVSFDGAFVVPLDDATQTDVESQLETELAEQRAEAREREGSSSGE